jgi:RNA polymerase sigma-70 factor (ECF subfamily)
MTIEQEILHQNTLTTAYNNYRKGLNFYAFSKMRDHMTSEDLVQNTFIKTWIYLIKGGKIDLMKAFLYHVLNNLVVDEYRKHKTTSLDILLKKGFEPSFDNSKHLFDTLDGKTVLLLIQNLPKKYQVIIRMKYVKLLSLKEISLITGQSKNTIAVQIHRGLKKLKLLYNAA